MQVVGDEAFDVFSPSVIENLVAGLGEWAGGERAVLVSGLGDDGQLAERAWPVGVGSECLLAVMLAAQADEVAHCRLICPHDQDPAACGAVRPDQ